MRKYPNCIVDRIMALKLQSLAKRGVQVVARLEVNKLSQTYLL